ncbi:hypothetical protein KY289_016676 [Solanum tuberosum]|nr:hypothetical protein KY289_016676 [Solanum tuberosum]
MLSGEGWGGLKFCGLSSTCTAPLPSLVTGIVVNVKQLQKFEDCICNVDCDCNPSVYGCILSIDCHCYFCLDDVMERCNAFNDSIKIESEKRTTEVVSIAPLQIQKMQRSIENELVPVWDPGICSGDVQALSVIVKKHDFSLEESEAQKMNLVTEVELDLGVN